MTITLSKCSKCKKDKLADLLDDCPYCEAVDLCQDCLCIHFNDECDGDRDVDYGEDYDEAEFI